MTSQQPQYHRVPLVLHALEARATHTTDRSCERTGQCLPSLADETRFAVDTATAAHYLNRKPQTLRSWASTESGPLRPVRVYGRLAWPVSELHRVMGVAA
jgi:hypothetical protein